MNYINTKNTIILTAIVGLDIILCYLVFVKGFHSLYKEDNWMENVQVILLVASCAIFLFSAIHNKSKHRILAAFFTLLCFIFVLREIDIEMFNLPHPLIFLLADQGRGIFYALLLMLVVLILKDYRHYLQYWKLYLYSNMFFYLALSALLLLIFSLPFDRKWIIVKYAMLIEELSEVTSYYLLTVAALFSYSNLNNIEKVITQKEQAKDPTK